MCKPKSCLAVDHASWSVRVRPRGARAVGLLSHLPTTLVALNLPACLLYRLPCVKPTETQQLFASSARTSRVYGTHRRPRQRSRPGPRCCCPSLTTGASQRVSPHCKLSTKQLSPVSEDRSRALFANRPPYTHTPSTDRNQAGCPPPTTSSPPSTTSTSSRQSSQHNRNPTIPGESASHRPSRRRRRAKRTMRSSPDSTRARTHRTPRA